MRGQDFSYQIGAYTVTRDGVLLAPDEAFEDVLQTLVSEALIEQVQNEPMEEPVSEFIIADRALSSRKKEENGLRALKLTLSPDKESTIVVLA